MQANSWHHEFFHFHLLFWIWQVWKGMKKLQKFEYLENEKSFRWNENIYFIVFEGLSFGEKKKINWQKLWKNNDFSNSWYHSRFFKSNQLWIGKHKWPGMARVLLLWNVNFGNFSGKACMTSVKEILK